MGGGGGGGRCLLGRLLKGINNGEREREKGDDCIRAYLIHPT